VIIAEGQMSRSATSQPVNVNVLHCDWSTLMLRDGVIVLQQEYSLMNINLASGGRAFDRQLTTLCLRLYRCQESSVMYIDLVVRIFISSFKSVVNITFQFRSRSVFDVVVRSY